jgi:hypothetical protein
MAKGPKVCFDRILPRELLRQQQMMKSRGRTRAISPIGKTWMNGSRLRVRFIGGSGAQHAKVREQAKWWTDHANLSFEFNDAPDAEIRIAFDENDGAWSFVGTDCRDIPANEPTMNLGFMAEPSRTSSATRSGWRTSTRTRPAASSGTNPW